MKANLTVSKTFNVRFLRVDVEVLSCEVVGRVPLHGIYTYKGKKRWQGLIDLDEGVLDGWRNETLVTIKATDCHVKLYDEDMALIKDYNLITVPNFLGMCEPSYGDYITMDVSDKGVLRGWRFTEKDIEEMENWI